MSLKTPLYSIVIPTRNRAHLLPFALQSALNQDFDDYEIVVVANNCQDNTKDIVRSINSDKIRYFETDKTLPMPENWEFAWTKAQGKYITCLPDDDALAPSTLRLIAENALHNDPEVVSWEDAVYYYPHWHDEKLQNILLLFHFGETLVEDIPSEVYKKQLAQFSFAWSSPLPKLLNCIANRDFFESWRHKLGHLFFPVAPDYSFAWISAHVCSNIRVMHRPFSIRGISDFSIGSNAGLGPATQEFFKEFGNINFFAETNLQIPTSMNHLAATFLRINPSLLSMGINPLPLDTKKFNITLAKQLQESRQQLPEWHKYAEIILENAKSISKEHYEQIQAILNAPTETNPNAESLRELHQRTAKMAMEYPPNIEIAAKKHAGDNECGLATLALKDEILVEPNWSYLYLFGDAAKAYNPYEMSLLVDQYYDLLLRGKRKQDQALLHESLNLS